jgi:outer membrane protein assembly factor BamB
MRCLQRIFLPMLAVVALAACGENPPDLGAEVSAAPGPSVTNARESDAEHYWPQWRGPLSTGVSPHAKPPIEWSETKNVRWKIELPGEGHSTPIVWGDRIFLTAAIPYGEAVPPPAGHRHHEHDNLETVRPHKFLILAVNRKDGEILWQREVRDGLPHEVRHQTGSYAAASPVTDGERIYAFFGSQGLYCLDFEGNPLWDIDLGDMETLHAHGEGASPALAGDTLIVNWDQEGDSFVVGLDKRTGKENWRAGRPGEVTSWSTPLVVEHEGQRQVVIAATGSIRSYNPETGAVLWWTEGLSTNVVASPVASEGVVIAGSSYEIRTMKAIRLDGAKGNLTGTDRIAWTRERDTPYVPSPLLQEGRLYFLRHYQGILTCVDAASGDTVYGPVRLTGISDAYASPVAADGRIYITSMDGATLVMTAGPDPKTLAVNQLDDGFSASPALVDGDLLLRGWKFLYCISASLDD